MRKLIRYILKKTVIKIYPLIKETLDSEFYNSPQYLHNKRIFFKNAVDFSDSTYIHPSAIFDNRQQNPSKIIIGAHSRIGANAFLTVFSKGGCIYIGEYSLINYNSSIWSMANIHIGSRVLISYNVSIFDNNSHSLNAQKRHEHYKDVENNDDIDKGDVIIEDDVWVGCNSIILKGVTLSKGTIVGAGSVVTKSFPPYSLIAGNPAKFIRTLLS